MRTAKEIISEYTEHQDVHSDHNLVDDLGLDSLDLVEIAFDIEDEYDLALNQDTLNWATVQDVQDFIDEIQTS